MSKIKNFFANNMNDVKKSFRNYPATYILVILATIILTVLYDDNKSVDAMEYVFYFSLNSVFVFFLAEHILSKMLHRIIGYVVAVAAGVTWSILLVGDYELSGIYRVMIGYIITLVCLCFYFVMRKMNVHSYKYFLDVFQNTFIYSIFYIVINIGVTSVLAIFISLILDDRHSQLFTRWQILLFGAFYVPAIILALTKEKSHISAFIKNLVKYVLYPITLIATLVIYIYIVKILVLQKMPSNSIYGIVLCIFIFGYLSFLMVKNYADDNKFYKISTKIYPWLFIPLIILQIYSAVVRINLYGCTEQRYLGIACIVAEVVVLVLTLYTKKDILEKAWLLVAIIAVIASMSPFNLERVSVESQVKRLVKEWPKDTKFGKLDNEEKQRLGNIYNYIDNANKDYKKIYTKKYVDKKEYIDMKKLAKYVDSDDFYGTEDVEEIKEDKEDITLKSIEFDATGKEIDVSKYKKVKYVEEWLEKDCKYKDTIEKLVKKYKSPSKIEEQLKKDNILEYKDKKICILYLNIDYTLEDDEEVDMSYYRVQLLLLDKDSKKEDKK